MKRKVLAIAMIISLTLSSIVGCGSAAKADAAGDKGELNLFVWTEYLPDSVVEKFEKETGITVQVTC